MPRITLATYNIHKGLSPLNRKLIIHEVRDNLHRVNADIVLLQEVQGSHSRRAGRFANWPDLAQHEHIADGRYSDIVYGLNARHRFGDHGNAILSSFPIRHWSNRNVSHHRFEHRGHLMAQMDVPGMAVPLTVVCVHLGLFHRSRMVQIARLAEFVNETIEANAPLVIAGDFNDWRARKSRLSSVLAETLGVHEAFESLTGKPARTFPAVLPWLPLDRIYVRGLGVAQAARLSGDGGDALGSSWQRTSDHVGLAVTLEWK
jgi:endonuclease/exonuclease/phosphatase family metal-dependent hydrolase